LGKLDDIDASSDEVGEGTRLPTGGLIIEQTGEEGIDAAYGSGRGRVIVQAKAHVEEMNRQAFSRTCAMNQTVRACASCSN
jgi:DNA gyrase subunit A